VRTTFLVFGRWGSAAVAAIFGAMASMSPVARLTDRLAIVGAYGVAVPVVFALVATNPSRAAVLRRWHRWSGLALGALLFLRVG
jgi:hypothetical protein